jgi:hypothetical protein
MNETTNSEGSARDHELRLSRRHLTMSKDRRTEVGGLMIPMHAHFRSALLVASCRVAGVT